MNDDSLFQTVGTKIRLVDRVVEAIRDVIVTGQLKPGMKLPAERELADELGVSRTVVREAVHILTAKGLLETRPGVGTLVREVSRDQIVEPLSLWLQTQEEGTTVQHLHQVRQILEVAISGLAAQQATETDVAELSRVLDEMEQERQSATDFAASDSTFHRELARMTHNPLLIVLMDSIGDLMREVRFGVAQYPGLEQQVLPDHRRILVRIAAGDGEGARQAMRNHLEHAASIQKEIFPDERIPSTPSHGAM